MHHQIADALDNLRLPHTIDLSILHDINNSELIEHIEEVGEIFYARKA